MSNKKERRKERYERNVSKEISHKKEAWDSGKLIEENHNLNFYTDQYSLELGNRLVSKICSIISETGNREDKNTYFLSEFRKYKIKIRDYIILSPLSSRNNSWIFLKNILEIYWDCSEDMFNIVSKLYKEFYGKC